MAPTPVYSTLLSCIYDEPEPIGQMGRGAHYSVFRCAEWRDVNWAPLDKAHVHDFAVIWDEDHDTRVIDVVEAIYAAGLLAPVQFIGERKGILTVIVAARFEFSGEPSVVEAYRAKLAAVVEDSTPEDSWSLDFGTFDRAPGWPHPHQTDLAGIIATSEHRVDTYVRNIDYLWNLGTRPYARVAGAPTPPMPPFV